MHALWWWLIAYVAGSVPFGLLIGRAKGVDLRAHGSGNIGATNAGRVLGKGWGLLCFALDVAKGLLPVLVYGLVHPEALRTAGSAGWWMGVAAWAVVGHMFPAWLGFKGGKGVATGLGGVLGFWPVLTLAGVGAFAVWVVLVQATGYVALASVLAAAALPLFALGLGVAFGLPWPVTGVLAGVCVLLAGLVAVRHRSNLARLREGAEPMAGWSRRARRAEG